MRMSFQTFQRLMPGEIETKSNAIGNDMFDGEIACSVPAFGVPSGYAVRMDFCRNQAKICSEVV